MSDGQTFVENPVLNKKSIRRWFYVRLEQERWLRGKLSPLNLISIAVILFAVCSHIASTEKVFYESYCYFFKAANWFLVSFFIFEFLLRMWAATESPVYKGFKGMVEYLKRPSVIVDILTIIPYFTTFAPALIKIADLKTLRILGIAKFGRFNYTVRLILMSIRERRFMLMVSLFAPLVLIIISSTLLYIIEKDIQPEHFGSILRSIWWSIITITTVGYGDVVPMTHAGKVLGSIVSLMGIICMTLPAGIISAAVSHAYIRSKEQIKRDGF